jgi:anthranilate phosphoribosyltransferase
MVEGELRRQALRGRLSRDPGRIEMLEVAQRVRNGENLSVDEMASVIDTIMQGQSSDDEISAVLLALREKGETVQEVAGAAKAMRQHMTPIRTTHREFIDTCGTGGDSSGTFNISTAAALVTAAAGVPVAKHGNRSITSRSGSADVLAALGVNIEAGVATVERCLNQVGICFCFAPLLHASMRHVAPVRKRLGVPTIFNMLGPLCNPASAPYQLLGVGKPHLRTLLSPALQLLGCRKAVVVCGADGLDEVTLAAATNATEVTPETIREFVWHPAQFGVATSDLAPLRVDGPEASAAVIRDVLEGVPGPARDIVVINAAAALWTVGRDDSLQRCAEMSAEAIDSGAARRTLAALAEASRS